MAGRTSAQAAGLPGHAVRIRRQRHLGRSRSALVADIESQVIASTGLELDPPHRTLRIKQRKSIPISEIARTFFKLYLKRTVLCFSLFTGQAFLYNAIFFTHALVLTKFYNVVSGSVGWYILPFAAGNFAGPLLLGRLFDTSAASP